MKTDEIKKLNEVKARARKAAIKMNEEKLQRKQTKNKNPWGYRIGAKGDEICIYLADEKNASNVKSLKALKWTSPYHWYVWKQLKKLGKLIESGKSGLFYLNLKSKEEKEYIKKAKKKK